MAKNTFLSNIGHFLGIVFGPKAIPIEAMVAELLLPEFSPLIAAAAAAVVNAENASIVANKQSGSGAVKSAMAQAEIDHMYTEFCNANGFVATPETKQKFVDAMAALLDSFQLKS